METEAQKGQGGRSEAGMWWGWVTVQGVGVLSAVLLFSSWLSSLPSCPAPSCERVHGGFSRMSPRFWHLWLPSFAFWGHDFLSELSSWGSS